MVAGVGGGLVGIGIQLAIQYGVHSVLISSYYRPICDPVVGANHVYFDCRWESGLQGLKLYVPVFQARSTFIRRNNLGVGAFRVPVYRGNECRGEFDLVGTLSAGGSRILSLDLLLIHALSDQFPVSERLPVCLTVEPQLRYGCQHGRISTIQYSTGVHIPVGPNSSITSTLSIGDLSDVRINASGVNMDDGFP